MLCSVFYLSSAKSQTWDEWFNQKKTKLKYIAQQIAAFEMYADYLKKGYDIVDKGWGTVNDIKHGDFDLHNNNFTSLRQVNSAIGNYDKVNGITTLLLQILQVNDAIKKFSQDNENLQATEKDYIGKVMANLLNKCADDLDELKLLTTTDSLALKDEERLKRIDELYIDIQDKYVFAKDFQGSIQIVALSRAKGTNDINTSKLLYGIKQ
ncbi:MAG: hypothetical protein ABJB05_13675 [Parafilimonas sp.]